jgi:histidinol-phosphate/aromatic aminotransferase/cobyric acid decarboxylase-like protein
MGLAVEQIVKLASNENPLGMSPKARAAMLAAIADAGALPGRLRAEAGAGRAQRLGMERIVLGNGSNDVLDLVARVFLAPDARRSSPSTPSPSIRWRRCPPGPNRSPCRPGLRP